MPRRTTTTTTTVTRNTTKRQKKSNRRRVAPRGILTRNNAIVTNRTATIVKTPKLKVTHRGNRTFLTAREFIEAVPTRLGTTQTAVIAMVPANPCYWMGTNISQQAAMYAQYRPIRFRWEYIPYVSVNYTGMTIVGTLWATSAPETNLPQTLMVSPGGKAGQCYARFGQNVPLGGLQQARFNCNGELNQSSNPFNLVVLNNGTRVMSPDAQEPSDEWFKTGYIMVEYTFELFNKLGSDWSFGRVLAATWDELQEEVHANTSVIVRGSTDPNNDIPIGTTLDYDDGNLKYNHSTLTNVSNLIFDIYFNDNKLSRGLAAHLSDDYTIRELNYIEYKENFDDEWTQLQMYGPFSYNAEIGVPNSVTVCVYTNGINSNTWLTSKEYNVYLTAWEGIRSFSLSDLSNSLHWFMWCGHIPGGELKNIWFRGASEVARTSDAKLTVRHTQIMLYNASLLSAGDLLTKAPLPNVCLNVKWGGVNITKPAPPKDEDEFPTGDQPEFPDLDPSDYKGYIIANETLNLQGRSDATFTAGDYYAVYFDGSMPYYIHPFTLDEPRTYRPSQYPDYYWIIPATPINDQMVTENTLVLGRIAYANPAYSLWEFHADKATPDDSAYSTQLVTLKIFPDVINSDGYTFYAAESSEITTDILGNLRLYTAKNIGTTCRYTLYAKYGTKVLFSGYVTLSNNAITGWTTTTFHMQYLPKTNWSDDEPAFGQIEELGTTPPIYYVPDVIVPPSPEPTPEELAIRKARWPVLFRTDPPYDN